MDFPIRTIDLNSPEYPQALKKIKNPPEKIFYRGELNNLPCLAMVGSRRFTAYGKQAALEIGRGLARAGLCLVSGLAQGIDSFAHQAALDCQTPTLAILGTGVDDQTLYPQSNLKLAHKILQSGGALISEYPEGTHGTLFSFPQRNRIISALSLGVVVVEAQEKSGSLITADYAKEYQKMLFAVPHSIYTKTSKGCNKLIKEGAYLAESANDILLKLQIKPAKEKKLAKGQNPTENKIIASLASQAMHVDELIKDTGLPAPQIGAALAILEIKGIVRNLGGNIYTLFN